MSFLHELQKIIESAIEEAGYDANLVKDSLIKISDRPDLSQFQSNFAFKLSKVYKKNPIIIANEIIKILGKNSIFSKLSVDGPGFININVSDEFLVKFVSLMSKCEKFGIESTEKKKILIDYGGPNVAKPLHVGHLRSALIGEGLKRTAKMLGHEVISDVHLGDWGRQMGMVISEIRKRYPNLPYFDCDFWGEYPKESPVTINELEEIYPKASLDAKNDENRMEEAREATEILQDSKKPLHRGYYALWERLVNISVSDLKKIYDRLDVSFDLWNGESDSFNDIPELLSILEKQKLIQNSDDTLIMDVSLESDCEVPPLILRTKNNTYGYHATELATVLSRVKIYNPDEIWYVADKRQELHFEQCFRAAYKSKIVPPKVILNFLGFGTMNGKDGKPFKTRDGGVMKLVDLLDLVKKSETEMINKNYDSKEIDEISEIMSKGCIKYADAMSHRETDYIFDVDKFTNINGKTGAYILYSTVRINSILKNAHADEIKIDGNLLVPENVIERNLLLSITKLSDVVNSTYNEKSLSIIADYLYELNSHYNNFYNNYKILTEKNLERRNSWLFLTSIVGNINSLLLSCLSIEIPNKI